MGGQGVAAVRIVPPGFYRALLVEVLATVARATAGDGGKHLSNRKLAASNAGFGAFVIRNSPTELRPASPPEVPALTSNSAAGSSDATTLGKDKIWKHEF